MSLQKRDNSFLEGLCNYFIIFKQSEIMRNKVLKYQIGDHFDHVDAEHEQ